MIRCERGNCEIIGSGPEIAAELEILIREIRNEFSEEIGAEEAEKLIDRIIEGSKKSDDEIDKEIRYIVKKAADELLRDIFGDAKEE